MREAMIFSTGTVRVIDFSILLLPGNVRGKERRR
jgi:hypothetical protein